MEPTLDEIIVWAKQAGSILRAGYGKQHTINLKGRIDLVTEIDQASEKYLVGQIHERYPAHRIEAEESGLLAGRTDQVWYIDPLDGTTNYAHHLPVFCVSIAYAQAGKIQLGVVYDPMRDECFSAARGQGAWLNGEAIHVAECQELVQSLLVTGFPYDLGKNGANLANFTHFTRLTQGVRRFGSAALDLCNVAAGRLDGYWEVQLSPWDLAAGALIVEEAGGLVTSLKGDPDYLQPPYSLLVGNPTIHGLMLKEFNQL